MNYLSWRHGGVTAKQLINQRVLLEAKRMLAHGEGSVGEIAAELGMADLAGFTKYFTGHTGESPSAFQQTFA